MSDPSELLLLWLFLLSQYYTLRQVVVCTGFVFKSLLECTVKFWRGSVIPGAVVQDTGCAQRREAGVVPG